MLMSAWNHDGPVYRCNLSRPNISLGDTLAGQQAAMGTLLALLARERGIVPEGAPVQPAGAGGGVGGAGVDGSDAGGDNVQWPDAAASLGAHGQVVDASIIESVFSMLEGVLPEYSGNGSVRG